MEKPRIQEARGSSATLHGDDWDKTNVMLANRRLVLPATFLFSLPCKPTD